MIDGKGVKRVKEVWANCGTKAVADLVIRTAEDRAWSNRAIGDHPGQAVTGDEKHPAYNEAAYQLVHSDFIFVHMLLHFSRPWPLAEG